MNALVTSGGTKVPIDDVRYIANFSKGNFGASLASSMIKKRDWNVTHFRCSDAPAASVEPDSEERYKNFAFWSYDDYFRGLKKLVEDENYDLVFLAAAVSDYTVTPIPGKMPSDQETTLTLTPTVKVIKELRGWTKQAGMNRFIQVGFKLVSGATSTEGMLEIAQRANIVNGSDYTVVNHLRNLSEKYVVRYVDGTVRKFDSRQVDEIVQFVTG